MYEIQQREHVMSLDSNGTTQENVNPVANLHAYNELAPTKR